MREERYPIYAKGRLDGDPFARIMVPIFTEAHQARTFIETFIGCDDYHRDGDVLELGSFTLKAEQMDRILGASLEGWELPSKYERLILSFKYGSYGMPRPKEDALVTTAAPRRERERRPDRPPGFVTISDLAATWNVLPMHARAALRASGLEKPAYGWAFDPKEVDAIKKIVVG